jgi:hypothetical protein
MMQLFNPSGIFVRGTPFSYAFQYYCGYACHPYCKEKEDGQVGGISILQYADDTILFMEYDLEMAVNMKIILCIFEQLSGLKINFHKSEIFYFGKAKDLEDHYKHIYIWV